MSDTRSSFHSPVPRTDKGDPPDIDQDAPTSQMDRVPAWPDPADQADRPRSDGPSGASRPPLPAVPPIPHVESSPDDNWSFFERPKRPSRPSAPPQDASPDPAASRPGGAAAAWDAGPSGPSGASARDSAPKAPPDGSPSGGPLPRRTPGATRANVGGDAPSLFTPPPRQQAASPYGGPPSGPAWDDDIGGAPTSAMPPVDMGAPPSAPQPPGAGYGAAPRPAEPSGPAGAPGRGAPRPPYGPEGFSSPYGSGPGQAGPAPGRGPGGPGSGTAAPPGPVPGAMPGSAPGGLPGGAPASGFEGGRPAAPAAPAASPGGQADADFWAPFPDERKADADFWAPFPDERKAAAPAAPAPAQAAPAAGKAGGTAAPEGAAPARATAAATPAAPKKKRRDPYLDNAKFLLIWLVILGHSLVPTLAAHSAKSAYLYIYVFHMPLFVMISGYLSRTFWNSNAKTNKLVDTFLVPYVIVECLFAVLRYALGEKWSLTIIDPAWLNWYLVALLLWRLSTPVWKRMRYPVTLSIIVYLLAGLADLPGDLSIDRFFGLMPFFVIGLMLREEHLEMLNRTWVKIAGVFVLAGGAVAAILIAPHVKLAPIYYKHSYEHMHMSWWMGMGVRVGLLIAALLMSAAIMALVPRRTTWFSDLGTRTLYAYILHGVVVLIAKKMGWLSFPWLFGPLGVAAIATSSFALAIILCLPETRKLFSWMLEPKLRWLYRVGTRPAPERQPAAAAAGEQQQVRQ